MDLLEYQAKELFREIGIPTLPSQTIKDPRQIKQLQIPYPVVLKSQVRSGGRGKAGGVRFVSNTIDAIAAARTIFQLSILGEYPEVILAEAHYNSQQEIFLAIVLDYELRHPVLLGSACGGMNVESLLANLQQVVVNNDFSLFYARRLTTQMGLSGQLIESVSKIIEKMYHLFITKDLDLIEINPLGVNTQGELMALDGKITVNDSAVSRHSEIAVWNSAQESSSSFLSSSSQSEASKRSQVSVNWLNWQNDLGQIAIVCNSFDLALLTWDLIRQRKKHPACAVTIINHSFDQPNAISSYGEQLKQILNKLLSMNNIKVILLNIWETEVISREIIRQVIKITTNELPQQLKSESKVKISSNQTLAHQSFPSEVNFVLRLLNQEFMTNVEFRSGLISEVNTANLANLASYTQDSNGFIYQPNEELSQDNHNLTELIYMTDSLPEAISQAINFVKVK